MFLQSATLEPSHKNRIIFVVLQAVQPGSKRAATELEQPKLHSQRSSILTMLRPSVIYVAWLLLCILARWVLGFVAVAVCLEVTCSRTLLACALGVAIIVYYTYQTLQYQKQTRVLMSNRDKVRELVFNGKGGNSHGPFGEETLASVRDFDVTASRVSTSFEADIKVSWLHPIRVCTDAGVLQTGPDRFSPYSVEFEGEYVTFVEVEPTELQNTRYFYYQQQRKHAVRLFAVPFAALPDLVRSLSQGDTASLLKNVIFLHSVGRCGSTLVCKLLGATDQSQTISEPDTYTAIAMYRGMHPEYPSEKIVPLLRALSWLHVNTAIAQDPTKPVVVMKFRAHVMRIAEALASEVSEAKVCRRDYDYEPAADCDSRTCSFIATPWMSLIRTAWLSSIMAQQR